MIPQWPARRRVESMVSTVISMILARQDNSQYRRPMSQISSIFGTDNDEEITTALYLVANVRVISPSTRLKAALWINLMTLSLYLNDFVDRIRRDSA